jgi:hypothetical protein
MGRIDDALVALGKMEDKTQRALELGGLISTLFKLKGVVLMVSGQLAYDSYANTQSEVPALELTVLSGRMTPRIIREVMAGQLYAVSGIERWRLVGVVVRFQAMMALPRGQCRDFNTDFGIVKLMPAEELTAERVLAAVFPEPDETVEAQARLLLFNAMTDAFQMDWATLRDICNDPDYRVGEDLARLRAAAKQEVDAVTPAPAGGHTGDVSPPAEPEA